MKTTLMILKIIPATLIFFIPFLILPMKASADAVSLKVTPANFEIQTKPPADIWAPFTIQNQSNQPINLTLGYKSINGQASQNGNVVFLKNGNQIQGLDKKIFSKIQVLNANNISQNEIALGPKQTEQLRFHITLPEKEPPSDYYFSLIFFENNNIDQNGSKNPKKIQNSFSTLQTGIGMNIFLAVGNKEAPLANIETFTTPFFQNNDSIPFILTIFDDGQHFISPNGIILIKNMFGQTIGKITIPPTLILAGTGRTITSNSGHQYANNSFNTSLDQNDMIQTSLIWQKHFLLGIYKATLSLSLSQSGPTYTRSIYFFAFPLNYLLALIIIVVIIVYLYKRVKKKMN